MGRNNMKKKNMKYAPHETVSSWGLTDNDIILRGLKNRRTPKARPVDALVEQGDGDVGRMGMVAAIVGRDSGAVRSNSWLRRLQRPRKRGFTQDGAS